LHRIARSDLKTRDLSAAAIRRGLLALLSHFPVYRTYNAGSKRSELDQAAFGKALAAAKRTSPASGHMVLDQLDRWLGGEPGDKVAGTRFQQLSAPVAAKSVEDTAFYRYGRLLSRNDVGFDAARLGSSVADFHAACADRLATFPAAMLATATHDHKRGEDLRARLAVLSEIPEQWSAFVSKCRLMPADRPDPADEIMLYQMIVGAWPLHLNPADKDGCKAFAERLAGWQQKALREAKLRTDWTAPNENYEATARAFLFSRFSPDEPFLALAYAFVESIAPAGAVNGLAQTVLKMTVPGMPDFFQGTEFWDFSLVDPDNRRPVDYGIRREALAAAAEPMSCLGSWRDGRIKQAVIRKMLGIRRDDPALFAKGDYRPLEVKGALADRVVAFARSFSGSVMIVVVPRLIQGRLEHEGGVELDTRDLRGSTLSLPVDVVSQKFRVILPGDTIVTAEAELPLTLLLQDFPMAVLLRIDCA
jgi:malto-oligosyltrehalose synthase